MSIKVAKHEISIVNLNLNKDPWEHQLEAFRAMVNHGKSIKGIQENQVKNKLKLYDVYTVNEVNDQIKKIDNKLSQIQKQVNGIELKIKNSIDLMNKAIGKIPDNIKNDIEFKASLKKEILEELKTKLNL